MAALGADRDIEGGTDHFAIGALGNQGGKTLKAGAGGMADDGTDLFFRHEAHQEDAIARRRPVGREAEQGHAPAPGVIGRGLDRSCAQGTDHDPGPGAKHILRGTGRRRGRSPGIGRQHFDILGVQVEEGEFGRFLQGLAGFRRLAGQGQNQADLRQLRRRRLGSRCGKG